MLGIAWIIGKMLEMVFPFPVLWHWHFARLAVILVVEIWALRRAKCWIFPLVVTSLVLSIETLFQVNEPGVFPYTAWLFTMALILVAWFTAKSYWGTLAAFGGSVLLNQALVRFTYEGIVRHADLPDPFIWNFGVSFFAIWAGLRFGWHTYAAKALKRPIPEHVLPVNDLDVQEQKEEQDLC